MQVSPAPANVANKLRCVKTFFNANAEANQNRHSFPDGDHGVPFSFDVTSLDRMARKFFNPFFLLINVCFTTRQTYA